MPAGRLFLLGLLGLVVAEAGVFLLAAGYFGWFAALSALVATSVVGMLVLARMGKRMAGRLADVLSSGNIVLNQPRSSGLLTAVGALLLVLPGFITDLIGLLLLIPAVQRSLIDRSPIGRPRPDNRVLELDRAQWHDLPDRHIADTTEKPPPEAKTGPRRR